MPARCQRIPPRRLVLSGGGIRVLSYIGVLEVLEEYDLVKSIREFCGVSAGALSAFMMALDYSVVAIKQFCLEFDFSALRSLEPEFAFEVLEQFGVDDGQALKHLLEILLKHKGFGPETTFQDLQQSGRCKELRVWAADLEMVEPAEFSARATPTVSVVTAIHASMAFPVYFTPVLHPITGHLLTDGGVFDNYPISFLTESEANDALGITFELKEYPQKIPDFGSYISHVVAGYYMPSYQRLIQQYKDRTIIIPCAEFPALHFEATLAEKEQLLRFGEEATRTFLKQMHSKTTRRHSVA